ncbi:MAG: D-alanyl-D-alanine carboxypeptidase [Clostridiales bacterium]|jgi:D-alanyl-D-alanine carboxypeptidase (penicillin-binding protein 5/6)|nr:D-alanyl-D-alanine carboxypeptidase [Clostridiales bacterium]
MRKKCLAMLLAAALLCHPGAAAFAEDASAPLPLTATAAILVESATGKVLYAQLENQRVYPASMTKILTALVVMDYLQPEDFLVLGPEINEAPQGSSMAYHQVGETILVENLLRGLLIPSGNESGCALAYAVAKSLRQGEDLPYAEAEQLFCDLMNEKAQALGAADTHFTNPHGFHDDNHYTTASDMSLFAREFMENPILAEIVSEPKFDGNGAGLHPPAGAVTKVYSNWQNHNKLIIYDDPDFYTYANGIKTGTTQEAGDCVAASAEKDGVKLIAIICQSKEPGRWVDAKTLFEHGFNRFHFETILQAGGSLEKVQLDSPRLGESDTMDVLAQSGYTDFCSQDELLRIERALTYDEKYLAPAPAKADAETDVPAPARMRLPIQKGDVLGKASFTLDGKTLFETNLLAAADAQKRTLQSDTQYYWSHFKSQIFTVSALPYWVGGFAALLGLAAFLAYRSITRARRMRRKRSAFRLPRKF